jgi:TolB-like protein/Flp pilus assembly protein TadD/DNA-binding winged helix-turn-helix (wHTH) protein
MELLILLVERRGELVSRDDITERLWGKGVFLEVDHSINTAVRKIRLALRDDIEKPRFVETVVGKGYRFAAPVIANNGDSNAAGLAELSPQAQGLPSPVELSPQPVRPAKARLISVRVWMLLAGVAALVIFTVALVLYRGRGSSTASQPPITSLAVLPLKNLSGDSAQEYLADGMTEAVIGRLSNIHELRVISRTSTMHFKDTQLSVPEIARALNVDAIVEGSVMREGNRVRVHAQLIRTATDEHFWSETYDRDLGDTLALETEIAQSIARKVEVTVTGKEQARLLKVHPVAPEVYESYLRGQFAKSDRRRDLKKSITYFEEAIRRDPTFAPAYASLAEVYGGLGTVFVGVPPADVRPQAIRAARKAVELDPALSEAHTLLAVSYQEEWQWANAEAEYKRALELNPNDPRAHHGFARWLLIQGRTDEAQAWSRRARELDPIGVNGTSMGWILFQSRHYEKAMRELRSEIAVRPDDVEAYWFLGFALCGNGQNEEAIQPLKKALELSEGNPAVMGVLVRAYARAGHREEALRTLGELKRQQQRGYVPAAAFVNAYLGLGDTDQVFVWCERAYQEKSNILQWIKVHPFFDPVRSDPRFADLLHRVGLDQVR